MRHFCALLGLLLIYLIALPTPSVTQHNLPFYDGSFDAMRAEAQQNKMPFFLFFHCEECGDACKLMQEETFTYAPTSEYVAQSYLAYRVDVDKNVYTQAIAAEYEVRCFPTIIIFGPDGQKWAQNCEFIDGETLLYRLKLLRAQHKDQLESTLDFTASPTESQPVFVNDRPAPSLSISPTEKEQLMDDIYKEASIGAAQSLDLSGFAAFDDNAIKEEAPQVLKYSSETEPQVTESLHSAEIQIFAEVEQEEPALSPAPQESASSEAATASQEPSYLPPPPLEEKISEVLAEELAALPNQSVPIAQTPAPEPLRFNPAIAFERNRNSTLRQYDPENRDHALNYGIQVASYEQVGELEQAVNRFERIWKYEIWAYKEIIRGKDVYRLILGSYETVEQAEAFAEPIARIETAQVEIFDFRTL